jgi:hypothetical protein
MSTTKDHDEGGASGSETPHRSSSARPNPAPTSASRAAEPEPEGKSVSCNVPFCPICTVLSTAQHLQPEILGHLLAAAREVSMAVRAAVDQRGDQVAPKQQEGLQHIDLA